jgi:hypothetical protein
MYVAENSTMTGLTDEITKWFKEQKEKKEWVNLKDQMEEKSMNLER